MKINWEPLNRALSELRAEGVGLPIWWRDDDAIASTQELDRLAKVGADLGIPIHVAVIPDLAEASLPPLFEGNEILVPMVHGWRHQRHLLKGKKDTEFGLRRSGDSKELAQALSRMQRLFGRDLAPIFVPPWNKIADSLLPELADHGYVGVSTYTSRLAREPVAGLIQINTHLDPIDWRDTRRLVSVDMLINNLVAVLDGRREGRHDPAEPLGILTHHLVHTEEVWSFASACVARLLDGGAVPVNLRNVIGNLP